jgi:hypothetical protein
VEDIPVNQIYYDAVEIMKQPEYSQILVKCFVQDPSIDALDSSIADASL